MAFDYTIDLDKNSSGNGATTNYLTDNHLAPDAKISGSGDPIDSISFVVSGDDARKISLAVSTNKFVLTKDGTTWTLSYTGNNASPNWQAALRSITITDSAAADGVDAKIKVTAYNANNDPISNSPKDVVYCFVEGTLIATPDGAREVQSLKIGDAVLSATGEVTTVKWVGVQTVSSLFADATRSFPIRIKAHAIAENVPNRDLLVSPDHALLIDGVLIHAGALINGATITREAKLPTTFRYYHVETPEHALILAENTPAETFIDNVDRMSFDNWAEHEALYGNDEPTAEMPYPRAKSARQVPMAVRAMLAERSAALVGAGETEAA